MGIAVGAEGEFACQSGQKLKARGRSSQGRLGKDQAQERLVPDLSKALKM
jgi:hypothetical protein